MISRFRVLAATAVAVALLSLGLASQALGAAPAWQPVAWTGPTNLPPLQSEIQSVFVDAEGGTFTLKFGAATTPPITFNASASKVESTLDALSTIGGAGGSVSVVGGPGGPGAKEPYAVTFGGSLANTNVAEMTTSAALSGGDTHSATVATTVPGGPGTTALTVYVQNIGGFESSGTITYKVKLPPGVTTTGTPKSDGNRLPSNTWACTSGAGQTEVTCTNSVERVQPSVVAAAIEIPITSAPGAQSGTIGLEVSGGGAATKTATLPLTISATPAPLGIQTFAAGAYDTSGIQDTRAGAHPYSANAAIFANTRLSPKGKVIVSGGEVKDIAVDLPPGFIGNPIAVPQCPESIEEVNCPLDTMVGLAQPITGLGTSLFPFPVFNTEAPYGSPAKFRFNVLGFVPLNATAILRSDEDYGITVGSFNTPQIAMVFGSFFTFWGTPADPSHDSARCRHFSNQVVGIDCEPGSASGTAFITSATDCAQQAETTPVTFLHVNTWEEPTNFSEREVTIPPVTGCDQLHFEADFKFEPSDTKSDSPASFRSELRVPSEGLTNPKKRTQPVIKDTVVKLPEGVSLNPAGAEGLQACTEEQIGYRGQGFPMPNPMRFSKDPQSCPEASKIGTGEVKSELLEDPLHGDLYLAAQGNGNPFGSLFAVYLVIEDPRHGIFIKLPGEVETNKQTGQFQVNFRNLPQLPFTYLRLTLKGGSHSALASPTTCGQFVTTATSTPWSAPESGPPFDSSNGFEINQGPGGRPCAQTKADRPFDVGLRAGTDSTSAGSFTPLTFQVTRPDGSQELNTLELTTAPGLSAKLKGIPQCSDGAIASASSKTGRQEESNPSCPAASQIGRVVTGAGAGPTPFYTGGRLYLAGPYKGAPLSVVAITPAVAGPFDLGNVVVRTAVFIDRSTAQVSAKADPIPQILEGVPLRIRDVRVILDRKDFALNPTSCDASAISAHLTGNSGAAKNLSSRFQVGGCGGLDFKPKFSAIVKGGTKRGAHPQFIANLSWPEGAYANTKDFQVTLPHSEFLDQAHIRTICTRVQALADACPPGSIYGFAEAETPLLDGKLTGPVFLKSSDHKLPDLAIKLRGPASMPVEVEFAGRIDSVHRQIRNTIEGLPDVPVSHFTLRMAGGKKGLLINSRNLCTTRKVRLDVNGVAQNNKPIHLRPLLRNSCKKARKHKRHHRRHKR